MTQFTKPSLVATTDDGTTLSAKFNGAMNALYSMHAGAVAPTAPTEGQAWADTSAITANPKLVTFKTYQGGAWYPIGTLNMTTNLYTVTGGFPSSGGTLTGPILFPPGALTTPSIAFDGDTDTGIWRPAAGQISMSLNGVQEFLLTASLLTLGGNLTLGSSAAPAIVLDSTGVGQRTIQAKTAGTLRWSMHLASSTAEGGSNSGSPFYLYRYDDAGASLGIALGIDRATGNFGINSNYVAGIKMYVQTAAAEAVVEARNRFINANTAADVSVNLEFATSAGALRGKVRGQREGSTNHGALILSSSLSGVAQDVLTLQSNKDASFVQGVYAVGFYGNSRVEAPSIVGTSQIANNANDRALGGGGGAGIYLNSYNFDGGSVYTQNLALGDPAIGMSMGLQNVHVASQYQECRIVASNSNYFAMKGDGNISRSSDGATVQFNPPSDERIKTNILPTATDALAKILALEVVQFNWIAATPMEPTPAPEDPTVVPVGKVRMSDPGGHVSIGFVAQRVGSIIPEAETVMNITPEDPAVPQDLHGVDTVALIPYLVRAIQQQQALIADLTSRIATLEAAP